jgi:hypothetical protein
MFNSCLSIRIPQQKVAYSRESCLTGSYGFLNKIQKLTRFCEAKVWNLFVGVQADSVLTNNFFSLYGLASLTVGASRTGGLLLVLGRTNRVSAKTIVGNGVFLLILGMSKGDSISASLCVGEVCHCRRWMYFDILYYYEHATDAFFQFLKKADN